MGIRFYCPNGHKLNVKEFQAGKRGICPYCGVSIQIPHESTRKSSKELAEEQRGGVEADAEVLSGGGQSAQGPLPPTSAARGPLPSTSELAASSYTPEPTSPPGMVPEGMTTSEAAPPRAVAEDASAQEPSGVISYGAQQHGYEAPVGQPIPTAQPVDPLDAAPNAVWYVRPSSGGQFGPATSDIMRQWLYEGRVGSDSLVWCEGWADWADASAVFPQLAPTPPAPAPPPVAPAEQATYQQPEPELSLPHTTQPARPNYHMRTRARSNASAVLVIVLLSILVVILAIVFIVVVMTWKPGGSAMLDYESIRTVATAPSMRTQHG